MTWTAQAPRAVLAFSPTPWLSLLQSLCSWPDPVHFPHSPGRGLNWPNISPGTVSDDQAGSDGQMTTLGPAGVTLVTGCVLQPPSWPTQPPPGECGQGRWKGLFLHKAEQALQGSLTGKRSRESSIAGTRMSFVLEQAGSQESEEGSQIRMQAPEEEEGQGRVRPGSEPWRLLGPRRFTSLSLHHQSSQQKKTTGEADPNAYTQLGPESKDFHGMSVSNLSSQHPFFPHKLIELILL